jgi:hypothetical protein
MSLLFCGKGLSQFYALFLFTFVELSLLAEILGGMPMMMMMVVVVTPGAGWGGRRAVE